MTLSNCPISSVPFPHDDPAKLALAQLFAQNGFVRVDGVFTPEEVNQMKSAMARIVDGFEPDKHPRAIFNTSEEQKARPLFEAFHTLL